jgi:hypothetical protein
VGLKVKYRDGDRDSAEARKGVGGHLRATARREVRSASCAAMAVAPSGPRLLELHMEGGLRRRRDLSFGFQEVYM